MFELFASGGRAVITAALDEARRRGDRRIGTEHLLLGMLSVQDQATAQVLGVDLATARTALAELDDAALAAVGVTATGVERAAVKRSPQRVPFTSGARTAVRDAQAAARERGEPRIRPQHLLRTLLAASTADPAAELLTKLGVDRAAVLARLS